jgi:preprotein translocase subunit SecB
MTGAFVISGDLPEEKQVEMIAVNAPSILYSSVREFLAMITAHGQHGKFVLPSVSFIDQKLLFATSAVQKGETKPNKQSAAPVRSS